MPSRVRRIRNRVLPALALGLLVLLVVAIILAPAESRLGQVVKLVYVHGALVMTGLATFTAGGLIGAISLILRRAVWYRGVRATSIAALVVWIAYVLSSMAVTGLTWGQVVAWSEPRVRATAMILLAAVLLAGVARLVAHRDFDAGVNVVMGIVPWILVGRAEAIRHPIDPIGGSGSASIQGFYVVIVLTVACLAATLIAWLWLGLQVKEASS